jgi:outer membrane biosynthesis protein TonB
MRLRRIQFVIILLALLTLVSSCKKKRPSVPQPQEQAPTISEPQPPPLPVPPETTAPPPSPPSAAATKPKPKSTHKKTTATKTPPKPAEQPPKPAEQPKSSKTVVENGGGKSDSGQLAASLPRDEAVHRHQSTVQLQQATEADLRGINRPLSSDEQAMVQQIRNYIQQSRAADADNDTERAYNLATKARLLANELIKR